VVLALPEDMLVALASVADTGRYQPVQASPSAAQIDLLRAMLAAANNPLLLLGGGTWNAQACADAQRFAEANELPVTCAFRFQDLLDNAHPNYAGDVGIGINPKLAARVRNADLLIAFGPRLGEDHQRLYAAASPGRSRSDTSSGRRGLGSVTRPT
jgi:acetolactate synthase-1/2/3 large subunit